MIIGIDIDDTLTDIRDELHKAAYDYAKSLGKNIIVNNNYIENENNGNEYQQKYGFTDEELKYFLKVIRRKYWKKC